MPRPPRDTLPDSSHRDSVAPTSSSSGRGPDERLPVNPRRTKVAPDQRKRVAKACNRCNQKRIKCSGDRPCRQCASGGRECRYPPPAQKVTIAKSDLDRYNAHASRLKLLESLLQEKGIPLPPVEPVQSPPPDAGDGRAVSPTDFSPYGDVTMVDAMDDMSEPAEVQEDQGKLLKDNDGTERLFGETSGAYYLDDCKSFIVTTQHIVCGNSSISSKSAFLASRGRYQTFDSRPLNPPPADALPLPLPPATEIAAMLTDISTYIQDGNGSFASGGIFYWPWKDPASITPSPPGSKAGNRHLALYHVGFALANLLKGRPSEQHFAQARSLLGDPFNGRYSLDDVPALALMALYLVENNRRDTASDYISLAAHISIKHGAHRHGAHYRDNQAGDGPVEEGRRRTFWTVYILDRWLSCLLGRQPSIAEDALFESPEVPGPRANSRMKCSLPYPRNVSGLPSPAGLRANIELARISHRIVSHQSYLPKSRVDNSRFAKDIVDELDAWNDSLPDELTLSISKTLEPIRDKQEQERKEREPKEYTSMVPLARLLGDSTRPTPATQHEIGRTLGVGVDLTTVLGDRATDRAYLSLHMSYNQLFILAFRPAFLAAVKKLVAESYFSHPRQGGHRNKKLEPLRFQIEGHHLCYEFRASGEAARVNLMIGGHIKNHIKAPGNKLLVADLHHIFSAAVVLLMYRISFLNWRSIDTSLINFAKDVFKDKGSLGSAYGKDCFAVLTELDDMVDQFRDIIHDNKWPPEWVESIQRDEDEPDYMQRLEQLLSWRAEPWEKAEWESPATDDMQLDDDADA